MVNIAADMRWTSRGALSSGGSASMRISMAALAKPMTPDHHTMAPPGSATMPRTLASTSAPNAMKGQRRRARRCAAQSMSSDAGSWERLSDVSAADEIGAAERCQVVRQECVGAEIDRVDAAEHEGEPPHQRVAPIGPPAPAV